MRHLILLAAVACAAPDTLPVAQLAPPPLRPADAALTGAVPAVWERLLLAPGPTSPVAGEVLSDGDCADCDTGEAPPPPPPEPPVPATTADYLRSCEDAGVPTPPPWGDPRWQNQGEVTDPLVGGGMRTELWTFTDANGTCAALPRYDANGQIALFGVICTSNEGQVCFWDNRAPAPARGAPQPAVPVGPGYRVTDGLGADRLEENCTSCHRGENPWVIDPDQPTAVLPDTPTGWDPVGPPGWEDGMDNPGPACGTCHDNPAPTPGWCQIAKDMVDAGIMPEGRAIRPGSTMERQWNDVLCACGEAPLPGYTCP